MARGDNHSGQTKIGQIPANWNAAKLADLAADDRPAVKAGPFGSSLRKEYYTTSGYKIYGQEQVISGDAHFGDYYIAPDRFDSLRSCEVRPGDILISLVGTVGQVLIVPDDAEPGIINPRLVRLSLDPARVNVEFIAYWLESDHSVALLSRYAQGGTMGVLNATILRAFRIPLPPLPEQRKIAEILGTWDEAIALTERRIAAARQRKKGLMQQLLTGKQRFGEFEGEPWREVRLGDLVKTGGLMVDGDWVESKDQDPHGAVRLIQLADVGEGRFLDRSMRLMTHQKALELRCTFLHSGDILLARMPDPIARACRLPRLPYESVTAVDVCIIRPPESVDPAWLTYKINSWEFRKQAQQRASGSTRARVSRRNLERIRLTVAPLPEQRRIADALSTCDDEIDLLSCKLAALQQQKKGLMQRLLTGRVRVNAA